MNNFHSCKVVLINNINNQLISRNIYKQYAFLAILKEASKDGIIKDFSKNLDTISSTTGFSVSTIYERVRQLKELNWVSKEKKDLIIKSYEDITEIVLGSFALDSEGKKIIKKKSIKVQSYKKAIDAILFNTFEYQMGFQSEKIQEKIEVYNDKVNNHLDSFKKLMPSSYNHILDYNLGGETRFKIQEIARINKARNENKPVEDLIDTNLSFSRWRIAKILGFKSKSSAHQFIKRVTSYNWLKEKVRYGVVAKVRGDKVWRIKEKVKNKGFFYRNYCLIKKMASSFEIPGREKSHGKKYDPEVKSSIDKLYDNIISQQQFIFGTKYKTLEDLFKDISPERFWGKDYCKPQLG
jgi:hypothetical protein